MPGHDEHWLTREVLKALERRRRLGAPLWVFKVHGGPMQRVGVPDLLVCANGYLVADELKHPSDLSKGATPAQLLTLGKIATAGGLTAVHRTVEAVEALVQRALDAPPPPWIP
jgi:hypothetical protein